MTNQHGFSCEVRTRNYKYRVSCQCGENSGNTTKQKAYEWLREHQPFGVFASVFATN